MEAPLARFDDEHTDTEEHEDWMNDFKSSENGEDDSNPKFVRSESTTKEDFSLLENIDENLVLSIEDLVNNFEDKLNICFMNYDIRTEEIEPESSISQEEISAKSSKLWKVMTENIGNVMPIDWSKSRACELQLASLNLTIKTNANNNTTLDLPEDDELSQSFDMHSLIIDSASIHTDDDQILTADQVIQELEQIMKDEDVEPESMPEIFNETEYSQTPVNITPIPLSALTSEILRLREQADDQDSYELILRNLSAQSLNELLDELESTIKEHNEVLVKELDRRDELIYEKEIKNSFISCLVSVQNKRKSCVKNKKISPGSKNGASQSAGTFLTTVIPYQGNGSPPALEILIMLTKILKAINDGSAHVPTLLTDYILKVICPTK